MRAGFEAKQHAEKLFSYLENNLKNESGRELTLYEILGVPPPNAEANVIERHYKALVIHVHPDRNTQRNKAATKISQVLNEARSKLTDSDVRKKYDRKLFSSSNPPPPPSNTSHHHSATRSFYSFYSS